MNQAPNPTEGVNDPLKNQADQRSDTAGAAKQAAVPPAKASSTLAIAAILVPGVLSAAPVILWLGVGLLSLPLYWIWGNGPVEALEEGLDFLLPDKNSGWTLLYYVGAGLGAVSLFLGLRAREDRADQNKRNAGAVGMVLGLVGMFGQMFLLFTASQP